MKEPIVSEQKMREFVKGIDSLKVLFPSQVPIALRALDQLGIKDYYDYIKRVDAITLIQYYKSATGEVYGFLFKRTTYKFYFVDKKWFLYVNDVCTREFDSKVELVGYIELRLRKLYMINYRMDYGGDIINLGESASFEAALKVSDDKAS